MDREDLEKIKQLSANATKEITRLQEEISRYKSGADSFEEGVKILKNLAAMEQMCRAAGEENPGLLVLFDD